jgi:hypothetical protein
VYGLMRTHTLMLSSMPRCKHENRRHPKQLDLQDRKSDEQSQPNAPKTNKKQSAIGISTTVCQPHQKIKVMRAYLA